MATRVHVCPYCGKTNDRVTALQRNFKPKSGDVSICIDCGHYSIFDFKRKGNMRKATPEESADIDKNPLVREARAAWREMHEGRTRH